jgi:hypothetical protein
MARRHVHRPHSYAPSRGSRWEPRPAQPRRRGQSRQAAPRSAAHSARTTSCLRASVPPRSSPRARAGLAAPGQCAQLEALKPQAPEPHGDRRCATKVPAVERPPRLSAQGLPPRHPVPRQRNPGPRQARPAPAAHRRLAVPEPRPAVAQTAQATAVGRRGPVVVGPARLPVAEQGLAVVVAARGLREAATV